MDSKAYNLGQAAKQAELNGEDPLWNPYKKNSSSWHDWNKGYNDN